MKALDIAFKDLTRSFRSSFAVVFMFVVPLLVTGMFYFMFGNIASNGEFNLPKTKVIVANLDQGGPHFQISTKNSPDGKKVRTMGELVVNILQSEETADLLQTTLAPSAAAARAAVDRQAAQVAVIIPPDFSRNFADTDRQAAIEFYQDPTLTIGPEIIRAILNRFVDGLGGVKIAVNVFLDEAAPGDEALTGQVVQQYMDISLMQTTDLAKALLDIRTPAAAPKREENMLLSIVGPIMGGMMIFYAFFTGASTAQSILREEEERTLPRLFTTPTPQAVILTGKFLAVFLTVLVQVVVLLVVAHLIFGIQWGQPAPVALAAAGIVFSAASFGICVNSFLKNTKQSGVVFGGVLTVTGMVGMISTFFQGSPTAALLGGTVSLLVPQGWAVRGLLQAMNSAPANESGLTALALLGWSAAFFIIGVWRFNKRYA
jgi:ABC-type transport system involved in multi-copper enzyme maturation permease subunit